MIKVIIFKAREGKITGFKVTGHSGYDTHGKDIVCSAVSALAQTSLLGLLKVAEADVDYKISEGYLICSLKGPESGRKDIMCGAILETMYEGFKSIKESYEKHIDIVEEEV
ncbi:MAG TPA: ribosomal-processing cysteine protease Prp [Bacillota bacterium]|nr:ribosomal-processing cysteine protease Prp [Bacillota bacterium]HOR85241.1 ribosomal-processing cysteine protease Prp [Bacillota bacterium]HPL52917.1 ribosomal-processing cysteine protease Prp [Bacillota bacterium]